MTTKERIEKLSATWAATKGEAEGEKVADKAAETKLAAADAPAADAPAEKAPDMGAKLDEVIAKLADMDKRLAALEGTGKEDAVAMSKVSESVAEVVSIAAELSKEVEAMKIVPANTKKTELKKETPAEGVTANGEVNMLGKSADNYMVHMLKARVAK